jgi:SAM-dependent methyltransferase
MDILDWIDETLKPRVCSSTEFIYDDMDSQSGRCLPIIYQPFDPANRGHWCDRGMALDFYFSTGGGRLLDFGPGDGWPSLLVAPFADEVIGVDASRRRVEVCTENAARLEADNVSFLEIDPEAPLPFEDNSFDGVMAASSVEETAKPRFVLEEFCRILKPGGRLRMSYDAINRYKGDLERDVWHWQEDDRTARLIIYDRLIEDESIRQYSLSLPMARPEVLSLFSRDGRTVTFDMITVPLLEKMKQSISDARVCILPHPSGRTFVSWLKEAGFSKVLPTHSGGLFAEALFDHMPREEHPKDISGVDNILRPLVKIAVGMPAPVTDNPMITAVK